MRVRRVNTEYFNLYKEIPLFCALVLRSFFRSRPTEPTNRTLVVNTCLIGEFAASLPAVRDYIVRHPHTTVDLMVAPPLRPLAERVRGVGQVYTARSLYGRKSEGASEAAERLGPYDQIFVMRISPDVYRILSRVTAGRVRTGLREYSGYALHLWGSLLSRRLPKQWSTLNFEMLGGKEKHIPFEDIIDYSPEDDARVGALEPFHGAGKRIIIHTGASWLMKHWRADRWTALLERLHALGNISFIFVGGEGDRAEHEAIAAKLPFKVYSLIGSIDLLDLSLVLRKSDYFIGVDSGPRNLAHLVGLRSVCIFGPGPHFYMPSDPRDIVLDKTRGRGVLQMFFYSRHSLIDQISVDEVYDGFMKVWNS